MTSEPQRRHCCWIPKPERGGGGGGKKCPFLSPPPAPPFSCRCIQRARPNQNPLLRRAGNCSLRGQALCTEPGREQI